MSDALLHYAGVISASLGIILFGFAIFASPFLWLLIATGRIPPRRGEAGPEDEGATTGSPREISNEKKPKTHTKGEP